MKKYWVMTPYDSTNSEVFDAAWKYDRQAGTIAVGWRAIGNIEKLGLADYRKLYSETWPTGSVHDRDSFWAFWHEASEGDVVIARRGTKEIIAVGEITGKPYFDEQKGQDRIGQLTKDYYANFLPVKWNEKSIKYPDAVFPMYTIWGIDEERFRRFVAGPYSWIPIYEELLEKVLEHRQSQNILIQLLVELGSKGVPMLPLTDKDSNGSSMPLSVIDPFTFFASFNRWIKHEHRRTILEFLQEKLGVKSEIPYDFMGIPLMNNQNSWFFPYAPQRQADDIDCLWDLADAVYNQKVNLSLFNRCLKIKQVGLGKLTVGLFWLRPNQFLPFDQKTKVYLSASRGIHIESEDFEGYELLLKKISSEVKDTYPSISFAAFKHSTAKDNEIIANVLDEDLMAPFEQWKDQVKIPLMPFFKKLSAMMAEDNPVLDSPYEYKRPAEPTKKGYTCLTKISWKVPNKALSETRSADLIVQMGEYRSDGTFDRRIFWGAN